MGISDLYCRSDAPISFMVRFINTPHMLTQVGQKSGCVYGAVLSQHPSGTRKNLIYESLEQNPVPPERNSRLPLLLVYKACESVDLSVRYNCNRTLLISKAVGVRHIC